MKDLTISISDFTDAQTNGAVYVGLDSGSQWHHTRQVDELITLDFDAEDNCIGVEMIGSAAQSFVGPLLRSLPDIGSESLESLLGGYLTPNGRVLTESDCERLADEAEQG